MADLFHQAKVNKVLDLIRRACANGTAREVATAIADDWSPAIEIDSDGRAHFPTLDNVTVDVRSVDK